jgi:rhodanese-related sulfurtransferase
VLVLCHHGARSLSVAAWLRNQGFTKAQSISGGIDAWSRSIDPTVPRY